MKNFHNINSYDIYDDLNIIILIMNYEKIRDEILNFRDQRDWKQFHNPKDLAIAISIEAGELEEIFLWKSQEESYKIWREDTRVREEFSDIFNFMVLFAEECGIDIEKEVLDKLKKNGEKYTLEKAKGKSDKYTKL